MLEEIDQSASSFLSIVGLPEGSIIRAVQEPNSCKNTRRENLQVVLERLWRRFECFYHKFGSRDEYFPPTGKTKYFNSENIVHL